MSDVADDELLDNAREELDFDKRREHYVAAQELLWEEGGTLIPYHVNQLRVFRESVKNVDAVTILQLDWHKITNND